MVLQGKGMYVWKIASCEAGDVNKISATARASGYTHVLIKIANGTAPYNVEYNTGIDHAARLSSALHNEGIQAWGWHYVYGTNPTGEASKAIQRIQETGVDGYVIDAESEYKQPGRRDAAKRFMSHLRSSLATFPIALSSFRYPSYHPELPWREFLEKVDYNMPQVYWMQAHNPGQQLIQSVRQFQAMVPFRPILPTGAAFGEHGWKPTAGEVLKFLETAKELKLSAANFWEWSHARDNTKLPDIWNTISDFRWEGPPKDIADLFIDALNAHDADKVAAFYTPTAVHISANRTIQGTAAISSWYKNLFSQMLPNATFNLTSLTGNGSHRHFQWTAAAPGGTIPNGSDTIGILNGKIGYHYSFFTVSKP